MAKKKIQETPVEMLLGKKLSEEIRPFLEEGEKVIDVLRETYGPDLTIRRLVLTNKRLVIAIVRLGSYDFQDVFLENIDLEYNKGGFYDDLIIRGGLEDYMAHIYGAKRQETLNFMKNVHDQRDAVSKKKDEKQSEIYEIGRGDLGGAHDITHALKELAELKQDDAITEEEFEKKKKVLLNKL